MVYPKYRIDMLRFLFFLYQWLIAFPILLAATLLTALTTIVGCRLGDGDFWGYWPGRIWSRIFCTVLFIRVEVRGRERIDPKTSYVFVSNHQGAFDIFLIYGYLNHNFKWIMKQGLRKIPFVGKACESAGHLFIDAGRAKSIHATLEAAEETLQHGMSVVVFPEGSRTLDGRIHAFKKGAFQIAVDLSLPVVPLTIDGAFRVLPRNSCRIRPGKMILTIHDPIRPDSEKGYDLPELMEQARAAVASALPEEAQSIVKKH